MAVGVLHGLVFLVDGGPWQGPLSWRKPTTFGLSFGLTLLTLTWLTTSLRLRDRARWWLVGVLSGASAAEVALVALQAWRRVPSHFNQTTSFDAAVFAAMGIMVTFVAGVIVVVTVLAFAAADSAPSSAWAVRFGLLALVLAQGIGGLMIGRGVGALAAGDQVQAYVAGGTLKLAHAITIHGVQLLPVLAILLAATKVNEGRRLGIVVVAAAGYALIAAAALADAGGTGATMGAVLLALGVAIFAVAAGHTAWLLTVARRAVDETPLGR